MEGFSPVIATDAVFHVFLYAAQLALRVIPLLITAVFLAEAARLWLGDDRLRLLLAGRKLWMSRLRAVALGAVLPFCECGAFPVMLGLIRANVPKGAVLSFFLVSPVVSMPAFFVLMGVFGLPLALVYLLITSTAALAAGFLLEPAGRHWGMFKEDIEVGKRCGTSSVNKEKNANICCSTVESKTGQGKKKFSAVVGPAWNHTVRLFKRVFPYMAVVIFASAILNTFVPGQLIERALAERAPYDILIAALVGIPVYSGDCAMIALAAPLIGATGAVGAGIAFIIAGSGTSISGIIFMSSVFERRFIVLYVLTVFSIALLVGYLVSVLFILEVF